ncbi:hypothetical protein [Candidatus Nitrosocosmicus hydrocola]|uniref:hypothetical protein n=1 Tax=Candidatus Nitrosocosmicus hydrocola TaxID=1826872 RepID=UPI0011E5E2CA|nr:hypothetical protein [Candidatus Nitrosocosmicus hydrocola]
MVTALATIMVMGPAISSIGDVLAKQKYDDWQDCRDDHSKNWCKKYFKNHNDDDDGGKHLKVLDNHNHQAKIVK